MALPDLTGQNIQDTYKRVLQKGDDGQLYDGTGSAVPIKFDGDNVIISGSLTAMTYIVSESIVASTSGSSIFGNSTDDTHQFTGSVDVLGDVDATGKVQAEHLTSTDDATIFNDLVLGGAIIHAADIDTKIEFTTDQIDLQTGNAIKLRLTNTLNTLNQDTKVDGDLEVTGHITASGNISGSGLTLHDTITINKRGASANEKLFVINEDGDERFYVDEDGDMSADGEIEGATVNASSLTGYHLGGTQFAMASAGSFFFGNVAAPSILQGSVLTLDSVGDITIDAAGNEVYFKDNGTTNLTIGTNNGSITASGVVKAASLYSTGEITGSGWLTAGSASFDGDVTASGIIKGGSLYSTGEITGSGWLVAGSASFDGDVTSSGNIKANTKIISGDSSGEGFHLGEGVIALDAHSTGIRLGIDATWTTIDIGKGNAATKNISLYGPVTGSSVIEAASLYSTGEITGSGWLVAGSASFDGNITGSGTLKVAGNIHANGNIIGDDDTTIRNISTIYLDAIEDDATEGDTKIELTGTTLNIDVGGETFIESQGDRLKFHTNITASRNISASGDTHTFGGSLTLVNVDDPQLIIQDSSNTDTFFAIKNSLAVTTISFDNSAPQDLVFASDAHQKHLALDGGTGGVTIGTTSTHDKTSKLYIEGDLQTLTHITASGNITGSGTIHAQQISALPVGVADAALATDFIIGPALFADGDLGATNIKGSGLVSAPQININPVGVGDASVDIDLFVGAGFFDGDVNVSGNLTLGSFSGPVTVGDPSGSLTLSGSLTFKANIAKPAVSASTLFVHKEPEHAAADTDLRFNNSGLTPAFAWVTLDDDATADSNEYGFGHDSAVTSNTHNMIVTHDSSGDGVKIFSQIDGTYKVTGNYVVINGSTTVDVVYDINVDASTAHTFASRAHAAVDPVERTQIYVGTVNSGSFVRTTVDGTNCILKAGSVLMVERLA